MGLIHWSSQLETGHRVIDQQHQSLVETINRLHTAMKQGKGREEVGQILVFLRDYTVTHFQTEEQLMSRHAYPQTVQHKAIHHDLVEQVNALTAKHQSGMSTLTLSVMDFLEDWLINHIQKEDIRLGAFLNDQGLTA